MDQITRTVVDVVGRHLPGDVGARLQPETHLSALGIESLELVNLMLQIEKALSVEFPADMLDPETFQTPRTIAEAIVTLHDANRVAPTDARQRRGAVAQRAASSPAPAPR